MKLLEAQSNFVIEGVEQFLAPFVVEVSGYKLVNIVKDDGIIEDVIWKDEESANPSDEGEGLIQEGPLQLKYLEDDTNGDDSFEIAKRNIGCFVILIFLPPRFHLLLKMEVGDLSTLVRIRTDHWPCLAYMDEYLEALAFRWHVLSLTSLFSIFY